MLEATSAPYTWDHPHVEHDIPVRRYRPEARLAGTNDILEPSGPGRGRRRPHTAAPAFSLWWCIMSFLVIGFLLTSTVGPVDAARGGKSSERPRRLKRNRSGNRPSHAMERLNATTPAAKELLKIALPRDRRVASDLVWRRMHHKLVAEVEANDRATNPWEFIFYGDSTVEAFRGTYLGNSWTMFSQGPGFWNDEMKHIPSGLMGIAGDETKRLAYRLLDGEMPKINKPLVIGLQIGTADLHPPNCDKATQERVGHNIRSILLYFREQAPRAHILILGIFPKGASWPNVCSKPIWSLNAYLKSLSNNDSHIHFLDIGRRFLASKAAFTPEEVRLMSDVKEDHWDEQGKEINEQFLPDSLNPGQMGLQLISREVLAQVTRLLALADPKRYALPPPPIPQVAVQLSAPAGSQHVAEDEEPLVQMIGEDSSNEAEQPGEQFLAFKP